MSNLNREDRLKDGLAKVSGTFLGALLAVLLVVVQIAIPVLIIVGVLHLVGVL